jgi:small subunit ribosomal protein S19
MSRSSKKGPFVNEKLYRKVVKLNENRAKTPIRTWSRACTIIPEFVGHTFEVHNGNKHIKVFIQEDMVGHKLGEFSPTRIFKGHGGKKPVSTGTPGAPGGPGAGGAGAGAS